MGEMKKFLQSIISGCLILLSMNGSFSIIDIVSALLNQLATHTQTH